MKRALIRYYRYIVERDTESRRLVKFVRLTSQNIDELRVADIGCGFGRNLRTLKEAGFHPLGVEINQAIVTTNRGRGLECVTREEFFQNKQVFDILIMSHVIEHFSPPDLKEFIDSYLDHLKIGGHLIIATPLMSKYFYDDFDHIKPYHPEGILSVFGGDENAQVQYYSRNKLALRDIWFRTNCFHVKFTRARYRKLFLITALLHSVNLFSALVWTVSFGWVGKKDGWVGVFERTR